MHRVLPHGRVTGSRRGYEHCGHCANLTICLASLEASSGPFDKGTSVEDEVEVFEIGERRDGRAALLSGRDDINSASSSARPLDYPSTSSM